MPTQSKWVEAEIPWKAKTKKKQKCICVRSANKEIKKKRTSFLLRKKSNVNYDLPSSHSGGELPGNHNGLSGGSGSQTLETPFVAFKRLLPSSKPASILADGNLQGTSLFPNYQTSN